MDSKTPHIPPRYWQFYWPLCLMGLALVLSRQFQNGVLARFDNPGRQLAIWAMATSVFFLFNAALVFIPQMVNVLARCMPARRVCLRFTVLACLVLTAPLVVLSFTAPGAGMIEGVFNIHGDKLTDVVGYLRLLCPLVLVNGLKQYYTGLLIQAKRTGIVTVMHITAMCVVIATLLIGVLAGWSAVSTVAVSQVVSATVHLLAAFVLYKRYFRPWPNPENCDLTYGHVLAFFWPVAATSTLFSLSRPIIYSFVNRTDSGEDRIAALRVAFDFAMVFHAPINQLRHVMVTFGNGDLAALRRFIARAVLVATVIMVLTAATPLGLVIFRDLLGVKAQVLIMARQALLVLCGIPLIVALRNYFHGGALTSRRTGSMAVGGIARVAIIYTASWALFTTGLLQHTFAAGILLLGFLAETLIVAIARPFAVSDDNDKKEEKKEKEEEEGGEKKA